MVVSITILEKKVRTRPPIVLLPSCRFVKKCSTFYNIDLCQAACGCYILLNSIVILEYQTEILKVTYIGYFYQKDKLVLGLGTSRAPWILGRQARQSPYST